MTRFYVRACCVALCALLLSSAANYSSAATIVLDDPEPVTLGSLLAGNSITVGDKLFEDFEYFTTPGKELPTADQVLVIPIQDDAGNFGIRFFGEWFDLPGDGASGFLLNFNVTATDPALLISDVHLAANTSLIGPGVASVTETFVPLFNDVILEVADEPGHTMLTDSVIFDTPVRTLPVQKDILLFASGNGPNRAHLSFIDQTFSQIPDPNQNEIPEPATIGLVGMIGLFFGAVHMRRRLG